MAGCSSVTGSAYKTGRPALRTAPPCLVLTCPYLTPLGSVTAAACLLRYPGRWRRQPGAGRALAGQHQHSYAALTTLCCVHCTGVTHCTLHTAHYCTLHTTAHCTLHCVLVYRTGRSCRGSPWLATESCVPRRWCGTGSTCHLALVTSSSTWRHPAARPRHYSGPHCVLSYSSLMLQCFARSHILS